MSTATSSRGGIRDLIRESALYGVASLAGTLATFALAPLYLHVLSPAEYGQAALATTIGTFLLMAAVLSLDTASHRMVWESMDEQHRRTVFGNWLKTSLAASTGIVLLLVLLWAVLGMLGQQSEVLSLSVLWGLSLPLRVPQLVRLQWARAHRRPMSAATWAFSVAILTLLTGILFVPVLNMGATGVVLSQSIASGVVGVVALVAPITRQLLRTPVDTALLKRMFRFSLPLLPTALAGWFLAVGDRWILQIIYGSESVGVYQAAFTVAGLLSLPLAAFNQAFPPWAFSIHNEPTVQEKLRKAFALVLMMSTLGALLISLLAPVILRIVAQPEFSGAATMVPYLVFSVVAQAVFSFTAIGCNVAHRNGPVALAVLFGAISILPVVWVAGRWIGDDSVALSTLVSQTVTALFVTWSAEKMWPVKYGWKAPVFTVVACLLAISVVA